MCDVTIVLDTHIILNYVKHKSGIFHKTNVLTILKKLFIKLHQKVNFIVIKKKSNSFVS